ncbi:S-methyl-5-thioribose-1-phosphate isomerase [Allomyces macrogynus ATCC 38327]|uniref:Methylthioribose-1-phosphate isomerase n=1 Tax=Allomyces macrogynus (strain ATCC 38327) TaxID=578462 RepID=A0A0L0SRU3_ALLM3|nr:S-methyl-5-thioribose-1-phosphate isomerase [Allomyces macrogynus ATCC 38327]|eukprot:KNE65242.1 S-methyl-5-thioribose-1-phosphate isomerase [Allomyces macrogynus ATCC 38327]
MSLEAIRYQRGTGLYLLNQLLLPHESVWEPVPTMAEAHAQIKLMKVRGAPAIGVTAALALAVELDSRKNLPTLPVADLLKWIRAHLDHIATSRPTAVNLFDSIDKLWAKAQEVAEKTKSSVEVREALVALAQQIFADDVKDNVAIGQHGMEWLVKAVPADQASQLRVLTHCNTGSLATASYGTALGIIRSLHANKKLAHVYCTETRPYNQGSRLTAYELTYEKMPATLVTDSMVSFLLKQHPVHAIIVGADRIARNGDTANKIGTYQLALAARAHGVKMMVAAPLTTFDLAIADGSAIPIEQRPAHELIRVTGAVVKNGMPTSELATVQVAPQGMNVWNPGFDVTPAELIDAIVTEQGVITKAPGSKVFDVAGFLKTVQ